MSTNETIASLKDKMIMELALWDTVFILFEVLDEKLEDVEFHNTQGKNTDVKNTLLKVKHLLWVTEDRIKDIKNEFSKLAGNEV